MLPSKIEAEGFLSVLTRIPRLSRMRILKLALAVGSAFMLGCAAHTWSRPNTSEQEMQADLAQCKHDREEVAGKSFFLERCMFSKGYSED